MKNKNLGLYIVIGVLVILVIGLIIFMQSNSTKSVNYVDGNQSTQNLSANLDCSNCPAKIETKVETKTITESIYICSNGEEVVSKESCVDYINPNWDLSSNKSELIENYNLNKL